MTPTEWRAEAVLTYAQKKRAHICTAPLCEKKAAKRGKTWLAKCRPHLDVVNDRVRKHFAKKGHTARTGIAKTKPVEVVVKTCPVKGCGLRHAGPCDMPSRRREILTAGLGSWA